MRRVGVIFSSVNGIHHRRHDFRQTEAHADTGVGFGVKKVCFESPEVRSDVAAFDKGDLAGMPGGGTSEDAVFLQLVLTDFMIRRHVMFGIAELGNKEEGLVRMGGADGIEQVIDFFRKAHIVAGGRDAC